MRALNYAADVEHRDISTIAREFIAAKITRESRNRRNQVVVRKFVERHRVESLPGVRVGVVVDVDPQLVMRRIHARRGHRNQAAFVEHATAVHNEVTNPALDRIDNHSIEGSNPGPGLSAHVERLDERRLEAAVVQETELGSCGFVVHDDQ